MIVVGRSRKLNKIARILLRLPSYCSLFCQAKYYCFNGCYMPSASTISKPNQTTLSHKTYDYNVRIGELGRRGELHSARLLFNEMPQRDHASYASMISVYLKHDDLDKAEEIFCQIPQSMRSVVADSAMIHGYARAGDINKAKDIFDEMPERNSFSWTSLISGYLRSGKIDRAIELFRRMPNRDKNEYTWTTMVLGFARNGMIESARVAFDQMPVKNIVARTSMIQVYVNNNQVEEALEVFHKMPERNLYSWNIVIRGVLDAGRVIDAKELFDSMPCRNSVSWTTMVSGLARNGMTKLAREYFDRNPSKDIVAWNAMITAYTDEGCMTEACELFNTMPDRNIVTWNAMIDGYAKHGVENESIKHFVLMLHSGIRPNEASLTSLLSSCNSILRVLQAHGHIVHLGFESKTSLANTLITIYYKSGDIISAQSVFNNLEEKDVVTWTALILAYSNHGLGLWSLQVFGQMLRFGHKPDEITFVGVLSACSHAGLVRKGKMLFNSIQRAYGLEPTPEHYSCLIDILGRAGLMNDAVEVAHQMPQDKCDGVVIGALLSACMLDRDVGLADCVGNKLIELEPAMSGGYASLANVYAASGKWDEFSLLRKKMKDRNVKKVPGCSQIEVNGKNHIFFARDRSHPEMKVIYLLLQEKLVPIMQDSDCSVAMLHAIL